MRYILVVLIAFTQTIPKKSNTIIVTGVTFSQCISTLLDAGYRIDKSDSTYKTISTAFLNIPNKNGRESTVDLSIDIRLKGDTAFITGKFYNRLTLTSAFGSNGTPGPNDIGRAENFWPGPKMAFMKMNEYALLLKGQISYATN